MLSFSLLEKEGYSSFSSLVPSQLRENINADMTAVGVAFCSEPIGICIVEQERLLWVYVQKSYRGHGLGKALLAQTCNLLKMKGNKSLYCYVKKPLDLFFPCCGFAATQEKFAVYKSQIENSDSIFQKINRFKLSPKYILFGWDEFASAYKREIVERFPSAHPFRAERLIDSRCSFGLRGPSGIAGWIVCHRYQRDTLNGSVFVESRLRKTGLGPYLMSKAREEHLKHKKEMPFAEIWVSFSNQESLKMWGKRLEAKGIRPEIFTLYLRNLS